MQRPAFRAAAATLALLAAVAPVSADPRPKGEANRQSKTIAARGIDVIDGDHIEIRADADAREYRVRLAGIDAPELKQPFGPECRDALADRVLDRPVRVLVLDEDDQGQLLGVVYAGGRCVNTLLVRDGFAWRFARHTPSKALEEGQREAERMKRGLWATPNATPPWIWLRTHRHLLAQEDVDEFPTVLNRPAAANRATPSQGFWLNTSSGTRHNPWCRYFGKTKHGHPCGPNEGKRCNTCGG